MATEDDRLAHDLAVEAGRRLLVLRERGGEPDELRKAGDRLSHEFLSAELARLRPGDWVLSEEAADDPGRLTAERVWIVDPLDGTTNFAHGFPQFCVSLGLEQRKVQRQPGTEPGQDGTLVAAVIYDPMRDELFSAERGRGARLNGKPMRVSRIPELAEALVATGFPSRKRHDSPNIHFYQEFTLRSHGVRRAGSAALDLAYVASGRMEAFWEFNLNPWDTAAGVLLVAEAGGRVTDFSGGPFRLKSDEILASNGLIHEELVGLFRNMFAGRDLTPIPTPQEFAERRAAKAAVAG